MQSFRWLTAVMIGLSLTGCPSGDPSSRQASSEGDLKGRIIIDGSSTVAPVSTAVAEEFSKMHRNVRVPVGTSGTGGGFKKFCNGEIDLCDASRHISESEKELLAKANIEYLELKIGLDGVTVIVNPENDWVKSFSIEELKKIWEPGSTISRWSEIDASYPDEPLKLFGPDTDSGSFEYFTEEVCEKKGASRSDYQQSGDDNFLVTGVSADKFALGYFGYAYFHENQNRLRAIPISADGKEPVPPNHETIESGAYSPLSRPLFLYAKKDSLQRPEVREFLRYYLSEEGRQLVVEAGYVRLTEEQYEEQVRLLEEAITQVTQ